MLKTDYSIVSEKYDQNKARLFFEREPVIETILHVRSHIRILDLGCGTGNYIRSQNQHFNNDKSIEWTGMDPSPDMLKIAKAKEPEVSYIEAKAEEMSFPVGYFDFIVCNFAFHHFDDKGLVLDKIHKSLREDGVLKMKNIVPEFMESWWVYHYCPKAYFEDMPRFWRKDYLVYELEKRGLTSSVKIDYTEKWLSLKDILKEYERRDNSQLAMISDAAYEKGLEKIRKEMADGRKSYRDAMAILQIEARR